MKIGLLLGSFDPPHIGHVHAAYYGLAHGLDKVWIVPAWRNPWKTNQTSWLDRYKMCKILFVGENLYVSDFDSTVKSNYTHEGLRVLKQMNKTDEFYILGGTDIARQVHKWKEGEWILQNFNVMEVPRPGFSNSDIKMGIECSSTIIKEEIRNGNIPIPFIDYGVYNFIKKNNLYGEDSNN